MSDFAPIASIGLIKRIPSGHPRLGSRFHPREAARRRAVYVAEFEMAHTPVIVDQYAAFINSGMLRDRRWWSDEGWAWLTAESGPGAPERWGRLNRDQPDGWEAQVRNGYHPVAGVTAFEAEAYCAWLSFAKQCRARLPSQDEWEWAARGQDDRPYPWGEVFDRTLTNTLESEVNGTVPVASLPGDVSPFGVRDMAGNVQEWTSSAYTPLPDEIHPPGPLRAARGGSFNDTAYGARTSYLRAYPPGYFFPFLGFRIVIEPV